MTKTVSAAMPLLDRMNSTLTQSKEDNDRQFVTALGSRIDNTGSF